jgi:hypothetical protein
MLCHVIAKSSSSVACAGFQTKLWFDLLFMYKRNLWPNVFVGSWTLALWMKKYKQTKRKKQLKKFLRYLSE